MMPLEQSYIENILRLNKGKRVNVYMSYADSNEWRDKVYSGIIEEQHAPKNLGESFEIKYNPQNPEENTLILEPSKSYLVSGFVFATLGLAMITLTIVFIKKGRAVQTNT